MTANATLSCLTVPLLNPVDKAINSRQSVRQFCPNRCRAN